MFWKAYFFIIIILAAISTPFYAKTLRFCEILDISLMIIALIGLFGFAWKKQLLNKEFWKVFFVGWITWTLAYHYVIPLPEEALKISTVTLPQWYFATLSLIPAIPHFISIYKYAFSNR